MPSSVTPEARSWQPLTGARKRQTDPARSMRCKALALLAALPVLAIAQANDACISLKDSRACTAFQSASVSKNGALIQTYPFLQFVSDSASFDYQLTDYVKTSYVKDKYQNVFGCGGINFTNPGNMYARYTTTVLCNSLVQRSVSDCKLSQQDSRPVCADTCAEFAQSEAFVSADEDLCTSPNSDLNKLIRADFTTCSLPDGALSGRCVSGSDNEPENCGFGNSTVGLCSYCAAGGINSTDTCCYGANAEKRCRGVHLPSITPTLTFSTPTATSSPTDTSGANTSGTGGGRGLSGGAIAGIVIGALAGLAILAFLLFLCIRIMRRRDGSQKGSIFNQPSPARRGPAVSQAKPTPEGYEVLPGGRVARMSALEGHSGGASPAVAGPQSGPRGILRPPAASRRKGSLSSGSLLEGHQSPSSGAEHSSPIGMASQNSEQLPFFKDYYSQDDIHPGDKVAVLWAYQPRAVDEFALERGDMLKVAGIWDDGWATGVMVDERAEEWDARRQAQRDSGVSNATEPRGNSPISTQREMKAFPLVCVCLPEHWRKTIEGDVSTDSAPAGAGRAPADGH
ncbi:SH3 domain-containing protein [Hirsutella rhossiliensis]|uniref:SH3 domain-containing protein n=1 Tax=Hirsutella rhossiliensis TaxID=111463 RepID=A0A9P8SLY1_9HYPO|nr:SH3 domain-containing protein [Hirsutella rhossiliensis]KAH0965616.1 SH3 domain-containing protein [Hirsutella rhossiliensis]